MYLGTVIQTFDFLLSKIFASLVHNLVGGGGGGGGGGNGEDFALGIRKSDSISNAMVRSSLFKRVMRPGIAEHPPTTATLRI